MDHRYTPLRRFEFLEACNAEFLRLADSTTDKAPLWSDSDAYLQSFRSADWANAEIRLLTIAPAKTFSAQIRCSLHSHMFLVDETPYEALSYTWSHDTPSCTILLDNHPFKVTLDLHRTLLHLRRRSVPRMVWIDAICINQQDCEEKSHQIRLMASIYNRADRVLIWLGESDKAVESAFSYLNQLKDRLVGIEKDSWLEVIPRKGSAELGAHSEGISKILTNPWFNRVWTAQELVVAGKSPIMLSGRSQLEWSFVQSWLTRITFFDGNNPVLFGVDLKPILGICTLRTAYFHSVSSAKSPWEPNIWTPMLSMESVLNATATRVSTDPKDQVFAVLGMRDPLERPLIAANYADSVTSIYQRATVAGIASSKSLDFLAYATSCCRDNEHGLPSWSVDFSKPNWAQSARSAEHVREFALQHARPEEDKASSVDDEQRFIGIDLSHPTLEIKHNLESGSLKVLGTRIGCVTFTHGMSFRSPAAISGDKSVTTIIETLSRVDFDMEDCIAATLQDFDTVRKPTQDHLQQRLGEANGIELLESGVIWRILWGRGRERMERLLRSNIEKLDGVRTADSVEYPLSKDMTDHAMSLLSIYPGNYVKVANILFTALMVLAPGQQYEECSAMFGESAAKAFRVSAFGTLASGMFAAGKWLFCADAGFVGRAEHPIQVGDVLCILQKCTRPVILRACGNGKHQLISVADAHDVFDEESETTVDFSGREGEWIELC